MSSVLPSRHQHAAPSDADMDLLTLLTADSGIAGPSNEGRTAEDHRLKARKALPRRDGPLDPLMISAVLAGSGPVTRHHFGHGPARPGAYANCDNSRPASPSRPPVPSTVIMKSCQAPRSERLRLQELALKAEREAVFYEPESSSQAQAQAQAQNQAHTQAMRIPSPTIESKMNNTPKGSYKSSSTSLGGTTEMRKRRMSMDPGPLIQNLQLSNPTSSLSQSQSTLLPAPDVPTNRPRVKCMARTRVPTPHGEVFLHLYHNDRDNKEHLALVIDPIQLDLKARSKAPKGRREIRSKSLDEIWREGETEMERVVRGAYIGRLGPGGEDQASVPQLAASPVPTIHEEKDLLDDMDVVDGFAEEEEADIMPLVRIHSECFTGETIGSMRCDCGEQLDEALRLIAQTQFVTVNKVKAVDDAILPTPLASRSVSPSSISSSTPTLVPGRGVVIYMRQEGRGIGLLEKIRAYNLQDLGHDTVTANLMLGHGADERKYNVAAEILRDLNLDKGVRLLTNNPEKVEGMAKEDISIIERVGMVPRDWQCRSSGVHSHEILVDEEKDYEDWRIRRAGVGMIGSGKTAGPELEKYLRTKVERMGHLIPVPDRN